MIYKFIDNNGTFRVKNPHSYKLYFPLTNKDGSLLSSISPNLAGDIKKDNEHFLTPPAAIEDIGSNLLCRRDFFIKLNQKTIRLSYASCDTLEAGFLYHKIIKESENLHIEILNFMPYNLPVEVMRVKLINKSYKPIEITPTSFIPLYGRSASVLRDHRHVTSLLNRLSLHKYGIFLKPTLIFDEKRHKVNETTYFCLGFEDNAAPPLGQFPTLDYFCPNGNLINPFAIEKNVKPVTEKKPEFDGKETLAAFRFRNKTLKKGGQVNYFLIMGVNSGKNSKQKIMNVFSKLNSPLRIEQSFTDTKKYWLNYIQRINFDFKDKNFNNWLLWVKFQPTLRKLFGCSFLPHFDYGKGGRGWRDLWQDALTLLINEPKKAKKIIVKSFEGVKIDGSNATIITKKNEFISDRNHIPRIWVDHGIWPYITLSLYINKSGNLNVLNKNIAYFKDHLLKRAKEVDCGFYQKNGYLRTKGGNIYKGSILEHILIQHLTAFFNVGKHNIIRLENADWNDGLDMAYEEGESAAFSFMYAHNLESITLFLQKLKAEARKVSLLKELSLLLDKINNPVNYNDFREKQKRLDMYLEQTKSVNGKKIEVKIDSLIYDLKEKSRHLFKCLMKKEWLKLGFFNGYYDNAGKRVEGSLKGKIRMMLASQVFAVMSGGAAPGRIKKTWVSINKYLKDKKYGGFRLNTDFASLYLDLGRAFGFSYGDKENGAFFNHMVVLLSYALYKQKFIKEGAEVIASIYKMSTAHQAKIYPMIPEYFNNQAQGLYFYLTGSASWYIHTLIEEVLGIKFIMGNLLLEPKLMPSNFIRENINFDFFFNEKKVKVSFIREKSYSKGGKNKNRGSILIKEVFLGKTKISKQNNKYIIGKDKLEKMKKKEVCLKIYLI